MNETRRIALEFAMRINPAHSLEALECAHMFEAYLTSGDKHAKPSDEKIVLMTAPPKFGPKARPSNPLLGEVEDFLTRFEVKATAFGFAANGDSCFVKMLRSGRISKPETAKKIRRFMRSISPVLEYNTGISSRDFLRLAAQIDHRGSTRP